VYFVSPLPEAQNHNPARSEFSARLATRVRNDLSEKALHNAIVTAIIGGSGISRKPISKENRPQANNFCSVFR
jgi:hypothetical protein